jgi:hypothetical protein
MAYVVDVGLNFVRVKEEGKVYTFQCGEAVIKNDRVVEFAKEKAVEALGWDSFDAFLEMFNAGWTLVKVEG